MSDAEGPKPTGAVAGIPCGAIVIDGFDDAILGTAERYGWGGPVVVYDRQRVLDELSNDLGSDEMAEEFFDFNIAGAWVGPRTPVFFSPLPRAPSQAVGYPPSDASD